MLEEAELPRQSLRNGNSSHFGYSGRSLSVRCFGQKSMMFMLAYLLAPKKEVVNVKIVIEEVIENSE